MSFPVFSSAEESKSEPLFQSRFSLGGGYLEDTLGKGYRLGHGAISFLYRPLAEHPRFEVGGTLATQTPLHEENSYIELPLQESQFIHISELYIKHQWGEDFLYKLGMFPDPSDKITPESWPFYSVLVGYSPVHEDTFLLESTFRADKFSTYSQYTNSSVASSLNRYRAQIDVSVMDKFLNQNFDSRLSASYNYFQDGNHMLQSLSLGRLHYIDEMPPYFEGNYSYYDITENLQYQIMQTFKAGVLLKFFDNLKADRAGKGYMYGGDVEYEYQDSSFLKLYAYQFLSEENAIPPVSLSELYYPGAQIRSFGVSLNHDFNKTCVLESSFTKQFISPHLDEHSDTLYFEKNVSLPEILFIFKFIYKFSDLQNYSKIE